MIDVHGPMRRPEQRDAFLATFIAEHRTHFIRDPLPERYATSDDSALNKFTEEAGAIHRLPIRLRRSIRNSERLWLPLRRRLALSARLLRGDVDALSKFRVRDSRMGEEDKSRYLLSGDGCLRSRVANGH